MIESVVSSVGPMALDFEEDHVLIFFGPQAPDELREVAIIHEVVESGSTSIHAGQPFHIDDQKYEVVSVGTEAYQNLSELGHISVYFTEPPAEILPGSIYVSPPVFPKISIGSKIQFLNN
ncbi:PTS glucitol/sorbitol transporter subunit IIA [Neobacillus sp. MM2021_6]|uniref:PTS glucitol/sorbitol transporter subunit IIA n=1 Tax=Bacillaceae TaxID=186817 RepID=UPI00140D419D|nr:MULTISPECIES: PTS glucitol/sorbitol transporter subunit IIA [Bacillaceae]MBO0958672.1 PTS glucitol/sorbitol transporter subunit IIA [Neobacillus sp. MM2021_6]NHC20188.1 PTS glucitol/sorbitol transporter subunit IIA [Bacillus sp. MM2020_4]